MRPTIEELMDKNQIKFARQKSSSNRNGDLEFGDLGVKNLPQ